MGDGLIYMMSAFTKNSKDLSHPNNFFDQIVELVLLEDHTTKPHFGTIINRIAGK